MTAIDADPNRRQALDMGIPVATSDWIDAWAQAGRIQIDGPERESLIDLLALYHRWVQAETSATVQALREVLNG